jgi:hypothetical protein
MAAHNDSKTFRIGHLPALRRPSGFRPACRPDVWINQERSTPGATGACSNPAPNPIDHVGVITCQCRESRTDAGIFFATAAGISAIHTCAVHGVGSIYAYLVQGSAKQGPLVRRALRARVEHAFAAFGVWCHHQPPRLNAHVGSARSTSGGYMVAIEFSANARRLGILSAVGIVVLLVAYAGTLAVGFLSLKSPEQPIGDPMFSILEILIIVMMPLIVTLMTAVHAWAPSHAKTLSLTAVVFMGLVAGVTCSLHFVILTLSRQAAFAGQSWLPLFLSFKWPSVAYALDILAWDFFFPLSMFFAASVFGGSRLAASIRVLLIVSGVLALTGLSGVVASDMQLRNIGIVGYVGVFLIVAALLAVLFYRTKPASAPASEPVRQRRRDA